LTDIAQSIQTGTIDIGIAAGVESMTRDYGVSLPPPHPTPSPKDSNTDYIFKSRSDGTRQTRAIPAKISPYLKESPVEEARDCLLPMGLTSEAVAAKYGITRERQDEFAARSQNKAEAAQKAGLLASEIVPITVRYVNSETSEESQREVKDDEGIRKGVTAQGLAKLKPAFAEDGRSTAANSSQISDGASAVTLVRRDVAERLGLKPLGRFVGTTVKGCPPKLMGAFNNNNLLGTHPHFLLLLTLGVGNKNSGIGPAVATPALFEKYGITKDDVDIFELNEGELGCVEFSRPLSRHFLILPCSVF
jgi:acetyl-CoA acyltransferase 1